MYGSILNFRRRAWAAAVSMDVLFSKPSFYGLEDERSGLAPVAPSDAPRGRQVISGFTAPALLGLRPTPTGGAKTGMELRAITLDNLLDGDFIRPAPAWVSGLLAAVLSLGAAWPPCLWPFSVCRRSAPWPPTAL